MPTGNDLAPSRRRPAPGWLLAAGCWLLIAVSPQAQPGHAGNGERPAIPDISYPDLSGAPHNLGQWKDRVLLLNFWASWCAPCLAEIKHLVEFQRKFGPRGLQVVGLGFDEARKLHNVKRSFQINYPILVADQKQSRSILKAWGNKTGLIPYTVIFDRQGKVVRAHRGIIDEQQFESLVMPLLKPAAE
ncbi:MAG: TlpA disulfide reductase family protein [Candidatus Thiodiazotropha sp.]